MAGTTYSGRKVLVSLSLSHFYWLLSLLSLSLKIDLLQLLIYHSIFFFPTTPVLYFLPPTQFGTHSVWLSKHFKVYSQSWSHYFPTPPSSSLSCLQWLHLPEVVQARNQEDTLAPPSPSLLTFPYQAEFQQVCLLNPSWIFLHLCGFRTHPSRPRSCGFSQNCDSSRLPLTPAAHYSYSAL